MSKKLIKSDYRRKLEDRDLAIYKERKKIESVDGNMMESVDKMLMAKFGIHKSRWNLSEGDLSQRECL